MDVGTLDTDHGFPALSCSLQCNHICPSAIEHWESFGVWTKEFSNDLLKPLGLTVFAVCDLVPLVDTADGVQHCRVNTGVVVACKASLISHWIPLEWLVVWTQKRWRE